MPRPKQCRRVKCPPEAKGFRPIACGCVRKKEIVKLQIDEYEAIRLIDYEGLSQEDAARKMQVSRPTLTRVYDSARKTIAQALVDNKQLIIDEGNVEFYGEWHSNNNINTESMKKIAIPTTDGKLFPHFGKASQFTFVTIEDGKVTNKESVNAPEHAHGVAPRFVMSHNATEVIAGGMGSMPLNMMTEAGLIVHLGAPAIALDDIIAKYLDGTLTYEAATACNCNGHHEH
ncbi:MAG: DUF134 domain-containing protein [Paludibacteraceae bacterium]|nr:DUF134 domain-containing protein [Paludibacteraceae bacterium]